MPKSKYLPRESFRKVMKLKSTWGSLIRPVLALATITAISVSGIYAIPAHASIPGNGEYSCSTGTLSTDVAIPKYTITGGVVSAGGTCVGPVVIAPGVTSIEFDAFYMNSELTSITLPDSVTSIGNGAFLDATALTSITIPNGVISIGAEAFKGTLALTSITIPNGVTTIQADTFRDSGLVTISLPNSLTTIGVRAFMSAEDLVSVIIPNSVTTIGEGAFRDTTSLTSVSISNGVTTIGTRVFSKSGLTSISLPSSVTTIGYLAFEETPLLSVTIPASITTIDSGAFYNAAALASIYFLGNAPEVEDDILDGLPASARAFIQPTATGFGPLGGVWNGLNVRHAPTSLYRDWEEPLASITNMPRVDETIYATAFERILSRNLHKPNDPNDPNADYFTDLTTYPTPEEYVYRITRTPNDEGTSVDHQSAGGYEMLSASEQQDWYSEISPTTPYLFSWKAFMCVENGVPSAPEGLSLSYASREDGILQDLSFNSAHNLMFKDAASDWIANVSPSTRTLVGTKMNDGGYSEALLGDQDGTWWAKAYGILDVTSSCGVGKTLEALTILDSSDNPITTKSFVIPRQLRLDAPGTNVSVDSFGITIGVTGGGAAPEFYAALWGLTTIFDPTAPTPTPTPTPTTPTPTTAPASTTPVAALATTGANLEWLLVAGLLTVIAGSGFLAFSRRRRIW